MLGHHTTVGELLKTISSMKSNGLITNATRVVFCDDSMYPRYYDVSTLKSIVSEYQKNEDKYSNEDIFMIIPTEEIK